MKKSIYFFFICFLLSNSQIKSEEFPTDNSSLITKLDAENYEKKLRNSENSFIFYYSPFCKYSLSLAEELVKVVTFLENFDLKSEKDKKFKNNYISQFNSNADKETVSIEGTPVIIYYKNGKKTEEYNGARTAVGVFNFILKHLGFITLPISNDVQLSALGLFHHHSLVYFGNKEGLVNFHQEVEKIQDEVVIANLLDEIKEVSAKNLIKKYQTENKNTVVLFQDSKFVGDFRSENNDFKKLHGFLSTNIYDHILEFNETTAKFIFSQGKAGLFFYSSPKDYEKYKNFILENIPSEVRENILIYLLGKEENEAFEGRLFSVVGAFYKDFPSVKIHQRKDLLYTETMEGEITKDNVVSFVEKWIEKGFTEEKRKDDL